MASTIIFTQAFNAEHTIKRTIESVLTQTRGNFEYYILDNGSTDYTLDIINEYAKGDKRIKPIRLNTNDITNGGAFFTAIINLTSAKYFVWCDSDDEYTPDFLENMVAFSEENKLDIAACGYRKIDAYTNEITKHRALSENLVLYGNAFVDEFIKYRGFTTYLWGKLYTIDHLKTNCTVGTEKTNRICNDSIWMLDVFKKADRAGVFGKAMYNYYQYPRSLSHSNIEVSLSSYNDLWVKTKEYIEYYGPVNKANEDFLYAIYLSLVDEAVGNVFVAELTTEEKLRCILKIFSSPVWEDTMKRDANPQFQNLAARNEFVKNIKHKIFALPQIEYHKIIADDVLRYLYAV